MTNIRVFQPAITTLLQCSDLLFSYLIDRIVPDVPLLAYCDTNDKGEIACGLTCDNTHTLLSLKDSLNTGGCS